MGESFFDWAEERESIHPEFVVKKFPEHWDVVLVDEVTREEIKSFGLYASEEEAEQQAKEFQKLSDAEAWQ